jgi:hypothetical protein
MNRLRALLAGITVNLRRTIALVWRAGPNQVILSLVLDLVAVIATVVQLSFAATLLRRLRLSLEQGAAVSGLWTSVAVLAIGAAVVSAIA